MSAGARTGPQRSRLFVACDLPADVERAVAAWQRAELAPHQELRVIPALHLTLAFLGEVDADRVPDLRRILGGVRWRHAMPGP
jgi:2'-5' RNA ligase